jgi:hypothetical protein
MKKIYLLLIIAVQLVVSESNAQITTNLVINNTPPATLSTWAFKKQTIVFLVSGDSPIRLAYKIKTEIQLSDGSIVGKTDLTRSKTYLPAAGNTIYYAEDVMPLENMIFTGKYKNNLERTGKLPSDMYQICVQLVSTIDYAPISSNKCKIFNLVSPQLPILMKPYSEQELDAVQSQTAITFRWTPVTPAPTALPVYKIFVFEVLNNQSPMQALRSNMPILSQEVRGTTQYIWLPQGILNQSSTDEDGNLPLKKLVWTVQTFDNQEQPLSNGSINGDGVSEPVWFYIGNSKKNDKKK